MATEFQMFVLVQVTVNAPFIQALVIQITWTHGCTHVTVNAAWSRLSFNTHSSAE